MSKHSQPVSDAAFRTLHALRIKGFAKVDVVAELADVPADDAAVHLDRLREQDLALFREARSLWQLTPAGKEEHARQLAVDLELTGADGTLGSAYDQFLVLNEELKNLCGEWQLRDGKPNDHGDATYDAAVIGKLDALNARAVPVAEQFGVALARLRPYASRLAQACQKVQAGETNMFTGVMCGSYHDVWMELHEDLILSQRIDRAAEGSF